jgi:hypothetical protein
MAEQSWNAWFDAQLDGVANGLPFDLPASKQSYPAPPSDLVADLHMATRLARLDLGIESKTRANLRTRLAWMAMARGPIAKAQKHTGDLKVHFQISWRAGMAAVGLAVWMIIFSQSALAGPTPTQVSVPSSTHAPAGMSPAAPCLTATGQPKICTQTATQVQLSERRPVPTPMPDRH